MPFRNGSGDAMDRMEWSRWRGHVTTQVEANSARLEDLTTELRATLDRHEHNFNRRMDKQDDALEKVLQQARVTIERVTDLESEHKAEVEVRAELGRVTEAQINSSRFRLSTFVVGIAGAVGTVVGLVLPSVLK